MRKLMTANGVSEIQALLTRDDLRAIFQISNRTLGRLVGEGQFPQPIKVSKRDRWIANDVTTYLARQGQGASWVEVKTSSVPEEALHLVVENGLNN